MLLLFIDLLILASVFVAVLYVLNRTVKKHKEVRLSQALDRQKAAEDLAKKVEQLDVDSIKQNEKKIDKKLNSLH